ncbi:helix-turn-helix domain-containing protein [Pedobacter agri]|uniref:helix-turn-helix domain-containing protein n=1 Tax=Pedobacter agri TaxID=454586 RepID=UPI0027822DA4|nr:helix-turn-helix transcriptional regulator [Pedobacter agri]MDQ1142830.1 transcriptional regulator with XRE-family HTH domain [Pedobacter agri]
MDKHQKIFKIIGLNVKEYRKKANLTQQQLADKFAGDRSKISDIENGKENFMFSTLVDIAEGLNVDLRDLLIVEKNYNEK